LKADLALINGRIIYLNEGNDVFEAVGIKGGKIVYVGSKEEASNLINNNKAVVTDLDGKVVLARFIDSHTHLQSMGLSLRRHVVLSSTSSLSEALSSIREKAKQVEEGSWVIGFNWDESKWIEERYPIKADLDEISSKNPIILVRVDGHVCVVNSIALNLVKLPVDLEEVDFNPGIFERRAKEFILSKIEPSIDDRIEDAVKGIEA